MNVRLRPRQRRLVTSLLLVALLLHALVPAGFMPAFAGGDAQRAERGWLSICPASALAAALAARSDAERPPTGPICHGGRHADAGSPPSAADAAAQTANPADEPPDQTHSDPHDCPFATGSPAALPTAVVTAERKAADADTVRALACAARTSLLHRLPPSRGPPLSRLDPPLPRG